MLELAARLGVAVGIAVIGPSAALPSRGGTSGVGFVRATTEAVFTVALSRLLAERRPVVIDASV
jgi:hypothetical protein